MNVTKVLKLDMWLLVCKIAMPEQKVTIMVKVKLLYSNMKHRILILRLIIMNKVRS